MNVPVAGPTDQRVLMWVGIVCAMMYGLSYVFLLDFMVPPSPTLSTDEVVQLYAHSNTMFRFGVGIMILTGAFALCESSTLNVLSRMSTSILPFRHHRFGYIRRCAHGASP